MVFEQNSVEKIFQLWGTDLINGVKIGDGIGGKSYYPAISTGLKILSYRSISSLTNIFAFRKLVTTLCPNYGDRQNIRGIPVSGKGLKGVAKKHQISDSQGQ